MPFSVGELIGSVFNKFATLVESNGSGVVITAALSSIKPFDADVFGKNKELLFMPAIIAMLSITIPGPAPCAPEIIFPNAETFLSATKNIQ